jgi:hypothetical protein
MPEAKEKNYKVFLESADGETNRTMEFQAKDKAAAKRVAERSAEDIAAEHGGEAFVVKKVEEF